MSRNNCFGVLIRYSCSQYLKYIRKILTKFFWAASGIKGSEPRHAHSCIKFVFMKFYTISPRVLFFLYFSFVRIFNGFNPQCFFFNYYIYINFFRNQQKRFTYLHKLVTQIYKYIFFNSQQFITKMFFLEYDECF